MTNGFCHLPAPLAWVVIAWGSPSPGRERRLRATVLRVVSVVRGRRESCLCYTTRQW